MAFPVFARRTATKFPPVPIVERLYRRDLSKLERLPMFPDTALRAMSLANNPGTGIGEMALLIRRDGVMASAIIKAANRTVSKAVRPVDDVSQAVTRLGIAGCATVVAALGMHGLAQSPDPRIRDACDVLQRHSLFTAHLAEGLNETLAMEFRGQAYTGGLLHDIGRIVACTKSFESFQSVDALDFHEPADILSTERAVLSTDHCAIGHLFAYTNRLPAAISDAILHHHDPAGSLQYARFVALIAMADHLANHIQRERTLAKFSLRESPGYEILADVWPSTREATLQAAIPGLVGTALRETKTMLKARG